MPNDETNGPNEETKYGSIRDALPITGKRVVEVTCEDWEDVCARYSNPEDRVSEVYVHFEDGSTLTFLVTEERGFRYDGYPE